MGIVARIQHQTAFHGIGFPARERREPRRPGDLPLEFPEQQFEEVENNREISASTSGSVVGFCAESPAGRRGPLERTASQRRSGRPLSILLANQAITAKNGGWMNIDLGILARP